MLKRTFVIHSAKHRCKGNPSLLSSNRSVTLKKGPFSRKVRRHVFPGQSCCDRTADVLQYARRRCHTKANTTSLDPKLQNTENGRVQYPEYDPVRAAQYKHIWSQFHDAPVVLHEGNAVCIPPQWFLRLCLELYNRTGGEVEDDKDWSLQDEVRDASLFPDPSPFLMDPNTVQPIEPSRLMEPADDLKSNSTPVVIVDPYTFLSIEIYDEEAYHMERFEFPAPSLNEDQTGVMDLRSESLRANTTTAIHRSPHLFDEQTRSLLCCGNITREYICFGHAYRFPQRNQIPTSVGTEPIRLWVDPTAQVPCVLLQLSPHFPPLTWLPIRPVASSIRRALSEFAQFSAYFRDMHHARFQEWRKTAEEHIRLQRIPNCEGGSANTAVLRYMARLAEQVQVPDAPLREFPNSQEFFLGEVEHPEEILERFEALPFVFRIPEMRVRTEHLHAQTIQGGIAYSVFRCIHSKTVLVVAVHYGCEVKLPPTDHKNFNFIWEEEQNLPAVYIPVFVRVVWPSNKYMCGGGALIGRLNQRLGTQFASDIPIDAAWALYYLMASLGRPQDLIGVLGMRERVKQLEQELEAGPAPRQLGAGSYPSTAEIPSPLYTTAERLAMHIQYLAHLGDPEVGCVIRRWCDSDRCALRLGCAKAALETRTPDWMLFRNICSREPPGRIQHTMLRLVRHRKKRDLTDRVMRLREEEYKTPLDGASDQDPYDVDWRNPIRSEEQRSPSIHLQVPQLNESVRMKLHGFPYGPAEYPRPPEIDPVLK